jgi:hypothetical protein
MRFGAKVLMACSSLALAPALWGCQPPATSGGPPASGGPPPSPPPVTATSYPLNAMPPCDNDNPPTPIDETIRIFVKFPLNLKPKVSGSNKTGEVRPAKPNETNSDEDGDKHAGDPALAVDDGYGVFDTNVQHLSGVSTGHWVKVRLVLYTKKADYDFATSGNLYAVGPFDSTATKDTICAVKPTSNPNAWVGPNKDNPPSDVAEFYIKAPQPSNAVSFVVGVVRSDTGQPATNETVLLIDPKIFNGR